MVPLKKTDVEAQVLNDGIWQPENLDVKIKKAEVYIKNTRP